MTRDPAADDPLVDLISEAVADDINAPPEVIAMHILSALSDAGLAVVDRKLLLASACQFEGYAQHHWAKGAGHKADINQSWCDKLRHAAGLENKDE